MPFSQLASEEGITNCSNAQFPLPLGGVRGGPTTRFIFFILVEASTSVSTSFFAIAYVRLPRGATSGYANVDATFKNNKGVYLRKPSPNPSQREGNFCLV